MTQIVSINSAPSACDADGGIRRTVTSLDNIVANIDEAEGRNDALVAYIFALRDLQVAHNEAAYGDADAAIDQAQSAVEKAFARLMAAEFALNEEAGQ